MKCMMDRSCDSIPHVCILEYIVTRHQDNINDHVCIWQIPAWFCQHKAHHMCYLCFMCFFFTLNSGIMILHSSKNSANDWEQTNTCIHIWSTIWGTLLTSKETVKTVWLVCFMSSTATLFMKQTNLQTQFCMCRQWWKEKRLM